MNIIQQSNISAIKTNTLYISNHAGTGNAVIAAASGASILLSGDTRKLNTISTNYQINNEESLGIWLNNSAATIQFTLPENAPSGLAALFIRAGGQINVSPGPAGRIWSSASGLFIPTGQAVFLVASGSKYGVVSNGNNGWIPIMERGTIL